MSDCLDRPDPPPDPPPPPEPPAYDPGQFAWQPHDPDPLPQDPLPAPGFTAEPDSTTDPNDPDLGFQTSSDPGWVAPPEDPGTSHVPPDDDTAQVAAASTTLFDRDEPEGAGQSLPDTTVVIDDHGPSTNAADLDPVSPAMAGDDGAVATAVSGADAVPDTTGADPPPEPFWNDGDSAGTQADCGIDDAPASATWPQAESWRDADDGAAQQDGSWSAPAAADEESGRTTSPAEDPDVAAINASAALLFEEQTAATAPDAPPGEALPDQGDPRYEHPATDSAAAWEANYEPPQDPSDHGRDAWGDQPPSADPVDADDRRPCDEGDRHDDPRRHEEAHVEEERRETEHRLEEAATQLAIRLLEETEEDRAALEAGTAGPEATDHDTGLEPKDGPSALPPDPEHPAKWASFQHASEHEIDDAAESVGPAGAMVSDLMLHRQQPEALAALREGDPSVRSRPGRTPPGMDKNPDPGMQSAHVVPQSAMRDVPGYNPREAITRMLPTGKGHAHTVFDKYWDARCAELAAAGRETITVGELQGILAEAALRSGAFSPEEGETVAAMAKLELFVERGLRPEDELAPPGLRGRR